VPFIRDEDMRELREEDQYKDNVIDKFKDDIEDKDALIQELIERITELERKLVCSELSIQNALNFIEILRQNITEVPNASLNQG